MRRTIRLLRDLAVWLFAAGLYAGATALGTWLGACLTAAWPGTG